MSIYDKLGAKTANVKARAVEKTNDKAPRTAPGMFLDVTRRMDEAETRVEELEELLQKSNSRMIPLNELYEVEGRRRKLSETEYTELKENLRNNELVQAVTVRTRAEGGYEIISGNNRVAIYRELGRESILAVIQAMDDEQADLSGFYANLLQPSLPDFEKYLGFQRRQRLTDKNQKELAAEAGISEATVSEIFSFDRLPDEVKAILSDRPHLLGSKAAFKLAQATMAGRGAKVIEAVRKLAEDEAFTQVQAVAMATKPDSVPAAKKAAVVIKDGKKSFCKIEHRRGVVALNFSDDQLAAEWAKKVEDFIRATMKPGEA